MGMQVIRGLDGLAERPTGCAAAVGNFDGVHLGHQRILGLARQLADRDSGKVVAVTFEPPPARLLAPEKAPEPLMQLSQRCQALGQAGTDVLLVLQTTPDLLNMSPEQFARDVLAARLGPRHMVEGRSFFFGHNRAGNVDKLAEFGRQFGFAVHVVEPVTVKLAGGEAAAVSSSLVRRLVRQGRAEDAARCLGRPYTLQGVVVRGRGRGRHLRYPTANLDCGLQLLPGDGVYAGWACLDNRRLASAVSVGTRPTFGDLGRAVEAHILAEVAELYGRPLSLEFMHYLRPQEQFDSPEELRRQMDKDVQHVKERLE